MQVIFDEIDASFLQLNQNVIKVQNAHINQLLFIFW